MRRFLDWTAAQTAGQQFAGQQQPQQQNVNNNRRNSHHSQSPTSSSNRNQYHQTSTNSSSPYFQQLDPARDLEIQHLTKLLHEIKYYQASSSPLPTANSSQSQMEFVEKVHRTLPLFLKVFNPQQQQHLSTSSLNASPIIPTNIEENSASLNQTHGGHGGNLNSANEQQQQQQRALSDTTFISESTFSLTSPKPSSSPMLVQSSTQRTHQSTSSSSTTTTTTTNIILPAIPPQQMERFPDLLPFAFTIARLFVSEVRQRASNKHAEEASLAILQYLNPKTPTTPATPMQSNQNDAIQGQKALEAVPLTQQDSSSITPSLLSETAQGWNLLLSLNTLALSHSSQIIQLLCDASLPSTLIKCLYLFFDLPEPKSTSSITTTSTDTNGNEQNKSTTASVNPVSNTHEVSVNSGPLIKAFTQLLVQVCSYQSAIDELIKKDDLRLLIGIASSQCMKCNRMWRRTAFQTMLAISKNMKDNFYYLETNVCIQVFVENMHRLNSLGLVTVDEHVDMIKILLEFIYNLDTNNRNQPRHIEPLIEQFKSSRISDLIEEVISKLDESIAQELSASVINKTTSSSELPVSDTQNHNQPTQQSNSSVDINQIQHRNVAIDEYRRYGKRLVQSLTVMAKINICQDSMINIVNLKPLTTSRFEMFEQFRMPKPSAKNCILNYEVLRLFKMAWTKCQDYHMIEAILDATISLFNDDKYNYFIFESQQLLVYYMTSYNFSTFPIKIKQKLFKFLEFIIIETNYIPCLELGTLGTIITKKSTSNVDLILGLRTLIACLKFNSKFSDIFREIGLLEVIIELLIQFIQKNEQLKLGLKQGSENLEILSILLEASQYLLVGPNNANCTQFNESGAARHVFNCLSKPEFFHSFAQTQGSSSDDGNSHSMATNLSRTNTPPLSASQLRSSSSHISSSHQFLDILTHNKPSIKQLQKFAFTIIRQLILSSAGDEHLANLLGLLARNLDDLKRLRQSTFNPTSSPIPPNDDDDTANDKENNHIRGGEYRINFGLMVAQEVNLKISILKSLMIILKDSHRCRSLFRKAGGFIYIVSSLVVLEKALPSHNETFSGDNDKTCSDQDQQVFSGLKWERVNNRRVWRLIKNCLMTIVVAIRSEPTNLRTFSEEILVDFTEAIRKLGCFKASQKSLLESQREESKISLSNDSNFNLYKSIFLSPPTRDLSTIHNDKIMANEACCQLFRFLYDMSLDMNDGTDELEIYFDQYQHSLSSLRSITSSTKHQSNVELKSMSFDVQDTSSHLKTKSHILSSHHHMHHQHHYHQHNQGYQIQRESNVFQKRSQLNMAPKRPPSLDLENSNACETSSYVIFPCIILSILDLIPSCPSEDLMIFINQVMKSLFKHERNIQTLCEAGMISKLLSINWRISITDKNHILYETSEFMLEKLARQMITPRELRMFLRLNKPMKCVNLDEIEINESSHETKRKLENQKKSTQNQEQSSSLSIRDDKTTDLEAGSNRINSPTTNVANQEKISTDRIKILVEMMGLEERKNQLQPPFVEFNMNHEGFSSIFMPSIAPINVKSLPQQATSFLNSTLDIHANEKNGILGGVGTIERVFPPVSGLTFSTWFCIQKFPARSSDISHNIRLLTIYRGSASSGKEYSCFRIQISALDRALTVSTQEAPLFEPSESQNDPDCNLRIWTPELISEGKWHHLVVSINRSALKQSRINIYVDGSLVHHQKICYISNLVGSTNSGPLGNISSQSNYGSGAAFVNAFIGSLPQYRLRIKTQWRQGSCHLIEEPLNSQFVAIIHALGPNFIGNFQSSTKLYELAKNNLLQHQHQHLNKVSNFNQSSSFTDTPVAHKQLVHQQSAAVTSVHHQQHLTRVSSTSNATTQQQQAVSSSSLSSSGGNPCPGNYHIIEERILMSIDARAASLMSLARMRRIYTRFDCRQVSRVLGLAMHENSTSILLLHNTGVHLSGPSRGMGAITIGFNYVRCFVPSPTQQTLVSIGGCYVLLGLIAQSESVESFSESLQTLVCALKHSTILEAQMENINGYQILSVFFWKKKHLLNPDILKQTFSLITNTANVNQRIVVQNDFTTSTSKQQNSGIKCIHRVGALRDLVCECFDLWLQTDMLNLVLEFIYDLISSSNVSVNSQHESHLLNTSRVKNLKCLRDMDLLPRMLRLLPQYDSQQVDSKGIIENSTEINKLLTSTNSEDQPSFDTKAVYLIRQTVFELLNRTPRQTDLLYFGQFLASLLPSKNKERPARSVSLRNILLKSLLQMMTKNKQVEINNAMQEELVKILGFDWFMLFISGPHLNDETITLGFLNLMIVLSNEELYANFKSPNQNNSNSAGNQANFSAGANGSWLKEPIFPTIDGKFNIQLLGINVGAFFGFSGRRRSVKHEVLEASNFYLLTNFLRNLIHLPRIYLMVFQTMMGTFTSKLDSSSIDTIEMFDHLTLDILCDSLVGETHHKRRQTLSNVQFKCHELVVCIIYMIGDIMKLNIDPNSSDDNIKCQSQYPIDIVRFLMYLYNNNREFQSYCKKSNELIDALSESLQTDDMNTLGVANKGRDMTQHPATKEILELSRLIILDTMTDCPKSSNNEYNANYDQSLHAFERFLDALSNCREAQGCLVDMLMRQILLMIDSTARHNSIKTIGNQENVLQFQLLLTNSILISQIVTDKIWSKELYQDDLSQCLVIIDHQLCLAEQTFKFNELLPRNNPPYAFVIQRVLNRIILFALSRPMQHISDKMLFLDLLKRIYDNRTIIILNHMHCPQSAEFFVILTYCLIKIIEDNSSVDSPIHKMTQQPTLIEKQYGNPGQSNARSSPTSAQPSSSALMLVSMARKLWDAIYQSKKGILSEAFDISLSLPAFTLETSLDLIQLKPDIIETCERYWASFIDSEMKQTGTSSKQRRNQLGLGRQSDPTNSGQTSTTAASAAVNILSGRLTKVVNAASFVSRVVGATAGTMASNVNLVGERISQTAVGRTNSSNLSRKDSSSTNPNVNRSSSGDNQASVVSESNQISNNSILDQSDLFRNPSVSKNQIEEAAQAHISIIDDYIESQLSQKNHKLVSHKYLCDEWLDIEYEVLLRERALFGPDYGSKLDKWCLDSDCEGPRRMRKRMVNNTRLFYDHYPYSPEQYNPSNKSLRYRPPMSYDSHLYYLKTLNLNEHFLELTGTDSSSKTVGKQSETSLTKSAVGGGGQDDSIVPPSVNVESMESLVKTKPTGVESEEATKEQSSSIESLATGVGSKLSLTVGENLNTSSPSPKPSEGDEGDGDSTSFVDFSREIEAETNSARESAENIDSLSVLRLLEKNERISHMFRCSRVQGLDTYEGLLLFGREHFYLIDGFTLLKTREIKDIDSLPPDAHDPIIPNSTPNILAAGQNSKKICAKFAFDSVVEVHKRRYLLQPIALEVFSSDGRNTLIVFPRNIRNKVYSRLMTVSTQLTNNASESLAGQKSNVSVEGGSGLLSNLIGETSVTQRWVRGELSNFQYLMNLNTIAGRSYNDLMQYPIFPWILADYTSDVLDFSKPSTFRDLSRPVGAQISERLEQFKRRFADWDDAETPPYHYGTFYSSAMIVASYMVRMEPFTQHFLRLQGGHFDLADRMFHSVQDSWLSASKHNMADIKELIPEFFYLPEFLTNSNKFDLGIKQNGMKLNDVILPPWAKNDAREFIRLHRCALESDFVSSHLHEWIDLIFGYKQQGPAAVEAVNVFHHLFYEGNVDIYNTDIDPIKKNAVIGFINNFGQVPKQLFKKPHPARKVTGTSFLSNSSPASIPLTPILPSLSSAVSSSSGGGGAQAKVLTYFPQALKQTNACLKELREPVGQIVQMDTKNVVAVEQNKLLIPPEYCRYVAWGHADRSLRLGLYDSEKPIFVWEGSEHMSPNEILCCTIPNNRTMITSGESVITVWKIEKMKSFSPVLHLYGHVEPVTCLASSQAYSIIVSGSRDRTAIVWDLNRFTFVRQLSGESNEQIHKGPVSAIAINDSTGDIATCASSWLYLWTINGQLLAQIDSLSVSVQQQQLNLNHSSNNIPNAGMLLTNLPGQIHILSVCFSQYNEWDSNEVIITGASDGSVSIWSMRYHQVPVKQEPQKVSNEASNEQNTEIANESLDLKHQNQQVQVNQTAEKFENDINSSTSTTVPASSIAARSEPIVIKGRKRTDTMNSDWVKLSTSSNSTTNDSSNPILNATSSSFSDNMNVNVHDMLASSIEAACRGSESVTTTTGGFFPPELSVDDRDTSSKTPTGDGQETNQADGSAAEEQQPKRKMVNLLLNSPSTSDPSLIKFSKSDTSLVDSFVILGESAGNAKQSHPSGLNKSTGVPNDTTPRPQSSAGTTGVPSNKAQNKRQMVSRSSKLLPNHQWQRELYLRTILPRRSNPKNFPPAVTSITISRDHKTLFLGDASGRISSWSM